MLVVASAHVPVRGRGPTVRHRTTPHFCVKTLIITLAECRSRGRPASCRNGAPLLCDGHCQPRACSPLAWTRRTLIPAWLVSRFEPSTQACTRALSSNGVIRYDCACRTVSAVGAASLGHTARPRSASIAHTDAQGTATASKRSRT